MNHVDITLVGGGIVGLASAYRLTQTYPKKTILVLEKEEKVAQHQTGHNSGVLHTGIYYKPKSLKAENCRRGKIAIQEFCHQEEIDYEICGKVIVALNNQEIPAMEKIYQRGQKNGVQCYKIDHDQLKEIEPHTAGIAGIHVPEAGIVNYRQVCQKLAEKIVTKGNTIRYQTKVLKVTEATDHLTVETTQGPIQTKHLVNCAGLYSDHVLRNSGAKPKAQIVPFRGEYYELKPEARHLCKNLIYPVPNPQFPFLGVHFTRMIDGSVECGPNAVFAFAREGYTMSTIHLGELWESITYSGFQKIAWKYWRTGIGEIWRSFSKAAFVKALQRLVPEIQSNDLIPAPAGVRAQAITPKGEMVDDFLIQADRRIVHILNAPSPAATSALNIGTLVAQELGEQL
ncbi:MAG: L-2-hydroxyglutarate oxidase [Pirellulaceae bacterium]|nr:L-2-hydroxyglutarate oxidase [Pirellulaceae bacterium]